MFRPIDRAARFPSGPGMGFAVRLAVYVIGGGVLLAWINPRRGFFEIILALGWIGVCAAADHLLTRDPARRPGAPSGATRRGIGSRKARGLAALGGSTGEQAGAGRRTQRLLHTTEDLAEAEDLAGQLRDRKLHPILVAQRGTGADEAIRYEVRLPESEWPRAHPIMTRFSTRSAES